MKKMLHRLMRLVSLRLLLRYECLTLQFARIKAAIWYVKGVQAARLAFLGYFALKALVGLIVLGIVLMHVGFFLWIPWPIRDRAMLMLILGAVYSAIGLSCVLFFARERWWMERTGANDFVDEALRRDCK